MGIPLEFQVRPCRGPRELAKVTASGFSKPEVLSNMLDRIRYHDPEKANRWAAELVASGLATLVLQKVIVYASADVNIHNPRLPGVLEACLRRASAAGGPDRAGGANNQEVRNAVAEAVTATALSLKKPFKPCRIGDLDFELDHIRSKMVSRDMRMVESVLRREDPKVLAVPLNELANHAVAQRDLYEDKFALLTSSNSRVDPFYWLAWLLESDRNASAKRNQDLDWTCAPRMLGPYDAKLAKECVWAVWELLLALAAACGKPALTQVRALLSLYTHEFTKGKKQERRPLLFHALMYVCCPPTMRQDPYVDRARCVQTVATVNHLYRLVARECRAWETQHRDGMLQGYLEKTGPAPRGARGPNTTRERAELLRIQERLEAGVEGLPPPEAAPRTLEEAFQQRADQYEPVDYERPALEVPPAPALPSAPPVRRIQPEAHCGPPERAGPPPARRPQLQLPPDAIALPVVSSAGVGSIALSSPAPQPTAPQPTARHPTLRVEAHMDDHGVRDLVISEA